MGSRWKLNLVTFYWWWNTPRHNVILTNLLCCFRNSLLTILTGVRSQREFLHSLENTSKMTLRTPIFWTASFPVQTNNSITPRSRALLEELLVLQLFNKFPAFHGTRNSITCSQEPSSCLSQTHAPSPHPPTLFL